MSNRRLPDYLLERLALGELPEEALREAQEQLAREPGGAQRMTDLRASDTELLARHPPDVVAREVARRQRAVLVQVRRRRAAWFTAFAGAFAAGVLAIVLWPTPEHTVVKGDVALLVYRSGTRAELLKDGATARAGDTLQLAYTRARQAYGVIVSVDGAGKVTLHMPEQEEEAAPLVRDARTQLPHAFELDAAPGFERFFLIASDSRFSAALPLDAARKLATRGNAARTEPLALPKGFEQTSFLLLKASP